MNALANASVIRKENRLKRLLLLFLPVLAVIAFIACGDDDNTSASKTVGASTATASGAAATTAGSATGDQAEIEDTVTRVAAAGASDIDYYIDHVTANVLKQTAYPDEASCRANAALCIGEPAVASNFTGTTINGDNATTTADIQAGTSSGKYQIQLVKAGGVWKVDSNKGLEGASPTAS